ncbi:MAG: peptidylprolyl isomerase, partial [Candidatus Adiutrix sp.]|nr:peptidylprolyl isomerase [Candidatus Adiutrix sp.]
ADEADQAADHRDLQAEQLRNLISLELACQEALRLGYAPAEDELTRALELFKSDFEAPDQLYKVLDQYGSTEDDLKRQLIRNMALKKWQANEFLAEITVSDDEAREFYQRNSDLLRHDEMVRLSQILVGVSLLAPPAVKNQARAKAEAALKRLEAGEDFGAVAAQVNSEPEAAENRGDQGWFVRGQSLPAIEAAVWGLPVGGRTGLLESILGFHLIEVTDRRPAGLDSFENLRLDIVEFLAGRKLDEALARKMAALTRAADIEILDAELKGALPAAVPADEAK